MRKSKIAKKNVAFYCAILILVLVMIYSGLQIMESTVYSGDNSGDSYVSKTITRDGVDYFPRQDITVMMVLGIDQQEEIDDIGKSYNISLCDMVMLLIFDQTNEELRILSLNPDTMLNMQTLENGGGQSGTAFAQLALAHSYGSGLEDSCENTSRTISDFLYGIEIDHYLSLNLDGIALLNDAVGGVTVTVEDDFSQVDSTIPKGIVTLQGEQSINYIRSHRDMADQTNVSRLKRHKEYICGFLEAFRTKAMEDVGFILSAFDAVSPYLVTDCSVITISNLMARYSEYELVEIVTPEGESVKGTQYMEFYVDEAQLDELILRLFYAPK